MTDLAWMKTYIGDEAALTGHLTAEEFGAYERLRRHYWQHGALPPDDARMIRVTAIDQERWPAVWDAIAPLFGNAGQLDRIDKERTEAAEKRERKVAAGRKGARKRWGDGAEDGKTNGKAISRTMAKPLAEPLVTQWPPAPAPDSDSMIGKGVNRHERENDPFIPVPRSRDDGLAVLKEAGVFPFDYDALLPRLMAGTLRRSELDAA